MFRYKSFIEYLLYIAFFFYCYNNIAFKCIPNLNYRTSHMILLGLIIFSSAIMFTMLRNAKNKYEKMAIFVIFPFGIYNISAYAMLYPLPTIIALVLIVTGSLLYTIYLFTKRPVHKIIKKYLLGIIIIVTLGSTFSLAPIVISQVVFTSLPFHFENDSEYEVEKIKLDDNIATVSKIDDNIWHTLSIEEKITVLQTICDIECSYLGLPSHIVKVSPEKENLLGYYDEKGFIVVNINYLEQASPSGYELAKVILHECYHGYQKQMVKLYDSSDEQYQHLLAFDVIKIYKKEFSNYTRGSADNFEEYALQQVEIDARRHAEIGIKEYSQRITEYLN